MLLHYKYILSLRLKQVFRYIENIGFGYLLFALVIVSGILLQLLEKLLELPSLYSIALGGLIIISIELYRNDIHFLKSTLPTQVSYFIFKVLENILIISPILIFQLLYRNWFSAFMLLITSALLGLLYIPYRMNKSSEHKLDLAFIPISSFEIKFYAEKHFIILLLINLLLLTGTFHISLYILGMFLLLGIPIEIYKSSEPKEMVHYTNYFVFKKIVQSLMIAFLFISIPSILVLIVQPGYWMIITYSYIALSASIYLSISKKYHLFYGVNDISYSSNTNLILIYILLLPGGIFITLVAAFYFYLKAENHMKNLYA